MGPSTVVLSVLLIALTPHLGDALPNPTMVPPGTSSLTFVFDITGSMFDDLEQVRAGAKKIYETVLTQRQRLIYNYVLVPFHDPDLGEIIDTTDALYFQRQLGKVHVYGGGDCPEMTLTGIKKALEISLPSSFIYVFTDARSKDYHLEDQVINLIQEKQSSVVFVMTGDCGNRTHPGFRTYEKIAAASFGQVFHLQKSDVSAVLEYVRHAVQQKKVHLSYEVRDRGGSTVRQIPVDKHMTELTLSLSGDKDDEDFLDISIKDPKGNVIDRNAYSKEGGTIDLKNVKLIRLKDPMPGNWQVTTNSRLKHTLRVFGHGTIDFKYGFGAKPLETIELTRPRPVDGQTTYLMANMTGLIPPGTPVEISLIDYYGHPLYTHPASPSKTNPYLYFVGPFVPPKGLFFVQVKGVDDQDYEFQRIAPTAIGSVSVGGPRAYMAQITTAFINKPVNLSCVVESTAPYSLRWKHGDQYLGPPLFYSESDTSTWTINEVTQKERGDYSCEVSSAHGNHTARTYLETREPPPHIFNMRNASVTVGHPAYFHCQTQSASKAEIRWLRHGQQIGRTPNTMVFQNGTLVIWRASRADIGGYECQARNGGGLSTQNVFLSVYERPTIFVNPPSLDFVAGKRFNISCRASGDPQPEVFWMRKNQRLRHDHQHYIAPNNDLIINNPTSQSAGIYECRAQNSAGSASAYSDVREARPPKIQLKNSKEMVSRGEYVELQCLVLEGSPQPKIKWFKHNRELLYPLHENMVLSDSYLRIRNVQDTDTGQYSCVAENMAGREVAQTRIQVGSQPSIVPAPDTVRVNIERQVTLPCRAVGQPAPVIVWSKNGVLLHELDNPRYKQLDDGSLLITGADLEDQDTFTCTAKNEYGESQKSINVIITGLVAPVLGHVPPEEQLIEGHDLRLSCVVVLGTPRPILQWYKNGLPVVPTRSIIIEGAGSGLLLRNGNPKDEGQYKCVASSPAGNATLNINVSMIKRPTVKHPNATEEEYGDEHVETEPIKATEGETIDLPCRIDGRPKPTITWMLDGRGITADNKDYTILEDNTLRIHKTDRTTTGRFVCTAVNAAGEAEQVTQLSVVAPPLITPGNTNYNLIEGHPIVIPCDVHGEPQPEIQWFLNDELVTDGWVDEDGSLHIETANVFKGNLKCVAVNEAGRDEMTVSVTVHTIPKIFGSEQQQVVEASVNTTLLMPCPAEGHPVPKRVWSYDNLPILDGDEFYGTTAHILDDGSLSLDNVDFDHLGRFECKVSNVAGEDTLVYNLKVNQPPKIVSDTPGTIDVIQGLTLEIACKAVGRPNPTITWEKDGFQVIPSSVVTVDHSGTLRIHNARVDNAGLYRCTASNPAGSDTRDTKVIIQEPPTITGDTPDNYTAVAGDKVEMRCQVTGNPQPKIEWHKKGVPVIDDDHIRVTEDGTLVIEEAQAGDESFYTCKVSNAAGMTEKLVRLKVTTIPEIPDSHIVQTEVVRLNNPFSLYCPVFSTPLPTITWELSDGPLAEMDPNIQLSDDRRRLHVEKARITDAGVYKCIARNDAGSSSKSFDVEVVVPINIDESKWKRKMSVLEGGRVEIGCPVSGLPAPEINWIVEGRIMSRESSEFQGVRLSEDGQTLIIDSATADHTGQYHCVAQNKAGSLDVDVDLNVLTPPKLGENEVIEIVKGKSATLSCEDSGAPNTDLKSTISWSMLGSPLPSNVQMPAESRKAFVMEVNEQNGGTYVCTVVNNAGTSQKSFQLIVLEPPQFVEKQFDQNVQVVRDTQMSLKCLVTGQPHPTITWRRDGEPIALDSGVIFSDSFQRILLDYEKIHKGDKGQSRYTCHASNQAGIVTRDFFVTTVAPPEIKDTDTKTIVEVQEGHTATLNCNVSGDDVDIQWRKQGRNILDNEATLSEDRSRLIIIDAQKEHEDVYTCTAKNQAGQVSRDFQLVVLSPPRVRGPLVETLEVVEGDDLTLQCQFDGNPPPTVSWTKDGKTVPSAAQLLNENATLAINKAEAGHAGEFKCAIRNKAGAAEKTFKVHVIGKPEVDGLMDKVEEVEVIIGRPFTFACPVRGGDVGVERSWTRHALPVVNGENNLQVMADGAHLHLSAAMKEDEGTFTCIARNKAGESQKSYKLKVLVPPTITNKGGEYSVIENNSLVLPCEVEGEPNPKIEWRKDGHPINTLGNTFGILNDGQQFKINRATPKHKGSYACHASNKVGSAEINFDVDVITKPTVASGFKDQVEVVEGETALFRCPIEANNKGQITWLKDYQPIKIDGTKYTTSQDNRRLHLHNSTVKDESGYSCRIKNDAGETRADYKLVVFVPPKIVMLDKDKNRTVIENKTVTLSCPATGKPEPSITWFKDGERLDVKNISTIVATAQLIKNEIKITRVNAKDSGRFTCEAKNVAGVDEQDVVLSVMTPPKIEREGIPSDIEEVADRTVTISCPVYGKPTPTVTWLKNGRPLSDQQKIKTSANGQKLYFLKLAKDEADRYTCIAKNPAGEDKRDFNVKLLEAPSFDGPNLVRRVQTNEGRPSILTCPSSGSPPPTITWLKDGVTLAAGPRHVFLDNGRQLQISNTQVEDRARYTCIATNSVGSDDLETSLDVVSIPKISGEAHQILEVVENDRQDLHCDVNETDSGVEIEWQKAGQTIGPEQLRENTFLQLPSSGRRLHILSARVTDAGRYTCVVRNPAGEARKTFELKVYVPASINEANSSPDMQTIVPGKPITIECDVEGNPPPQVEWYHNEKKLKSAAGVRLSNNNETLTIQEATLTSGGRYTCRASNRAGNASKDFVIKMTGPPVFDQGIERLDVAAEDSIALTCIVSSGGGNLTVKWIVNGKPVENGELSSTVQIDDRTVKITKARLSDVGQYVCVATNEGGEARKTFELSVLEAPRFLDMTNRHPAIVVGRPLTLDCSTTGTPKPTILWLKDGERMNFTNLDERFSLMNDRQQLHIEEATPQDAGRYSCVAENRQGRAEKDLTVEILKPPKMTDKQHQREVLEGQSLTLQCPIEDQTAEITWTKHGVPITTSQRLQMSIGRDKLHIMGAESSDMAQYSCTAKNLAGEDSSNFNVTVATPPKILSPAFRQLDVIMNQTVEIDCETTGTPSPTIEWTRDGKTLQNQPNIKIDENGKVLRIVGVKESDAGRYSCKAENKAGQAEADTFISVISPPQVSMVADEQKVIASHGITIRCEVFGNPQPEVEWQKNGQPFTQGILQSQTFIHIQDAKPEDAGRYTCIGTNRAGEQRASTQLHVLTPPSIENEERLLQVKEGSDLTIDCAASGNPTPTISWKRDGVLIKNQNSSKLLISSANATDAGKYTCEARNEAGVARADFAVDVLIKPRFKDAKKVIKVINGENARLECKAEGHPTPTIKWLKGGRPLDVEEMDNLILSPRGETLMIVKTKRADAGSYSCVAKNAAGEAEHPFTVEVLTPPHIDETIDQNPRVVQGKDLVFMCPVLGNPDPKVEWLKDGQSLKIGGRFKVNSGKHLQIEKSSKADEARYTCHAKNDAGVLDTDFKPEVIAPPKFNRTGESVYEVIAGETIVMDCAVATEPKPEVLWFRGDNALVLTNQMQLSPDSMQLTIRQAALADGGKYVCRATNEAGSSDIDLILKVLIPPKIDRSNIIGNPLAIVNKSIVLECPVNGIPQPSVIWTIDGKPIDPKDTRIKLHQKNQTISIDRVKPTDQARFTCIATNKGGQTDQDFHLEVLNPPHLDSSDSQKLVKREGEVVTMVCPVRSVLDGSEPTEVSWIKDGRPVDHSQEGNIKLTSDNRRLTIQSATLSDAGAYTCVAMNRAGESTLDFSLEILSPPSIDTSKGTETSARVIVGNTAQLLCPVSGHPFPTVKWTKDGKEMIPSDNVRVIDSGQILEILNARPEDEGRWICTAENDAGTKDLEIELDVWVPPKVAVHSENPTKALGQSVIINCNVSGNPTPRISWTKGGAPILIDNLNTRISLKGTRLDIPKLERNDVGIYTCVAENEAGTAEASITVDVLVPPVISRDNIDMSPRLPTGQTLTLNCDGGGKPTPKLRWFVNDTELTTSNGDILIGTDNKYIQINNITLEDRGLYKCVAENVAGNDTLLYNVDVVQSPTIQNGGTQQVIEGDTAIIECAADGHPAPIVSWLRNGVRLETGITGVRYHAEGSTLKVVDARSSDSGIYVCQATNEAGTAQQAYTLEVLVSPKITTTSPEMGSVPLGQPFSLKCGVKGYPDPQIIWTLEDELLVNGLDGNTIAEDGTLFVQSSKGKEAHYRCTAKNDAGTDHVEYTVKTISAPVLTKDGSRVMNATESEPVVITCDVEGDSPTIHWQKNGVTVATTSNVGFNDDKTTLSFQGVKLNDEGEYTCVATNSAGNVTQQIQLYVGVPPKIADKPRRTVAKEGESVELWCEALGVPPPKIIWLRDNVSLAHTAIADHAESQKAIAIFKAITANESGVYTCKAENWAGTSFKDMDLVVITPPAVHPEKANVTANPRETVYLHCNATGNPEPVVSWVKAPNTEISASEKYQLLGTTLAIRNVLPEDEAFYHCVAKSEAGQALGSRRLLVLRPENKAKPIWVECDESGRPVKTSFVPGRGDLPDDNTQLLPWGEVQDTSLDGTNLTWKCLPGPRGPRSGVVLPSTAPHFIHQPKSTDLLLGQTTTLTCSAEGPPVPEIVWAKNGKRLNDVPPASGYSQLVVKMDTPKHGGNFTCIATNSVGKSESTALVEYAEPPPDDVVYEDYDGELTTVMYPKKKVALMECLDRGNAQQTGMTWMHGDRPVDPKTEPVILLNNGSMVVLDADSITADELKLYNCRIGKRKKKSRTHLMEIDDTPPKVTTPERVRAQEGQEAVIDCKLDGQPLTTDIKWMKNNQPLIPSDSVYILPNNSLWIEEARGEDIGEYKCRAANTLGTAFDDTVLHLQDDAIGILDEYDDGESSGRLMIQPPTLAPLQRIEFTKKQKTARDLIEELLHRNVVKQLPNATEIPEVYDKKIDFKFSTGDRYEAEQKVNRTDQIHPIIEKFSGSLPFDNNTEEARLENVTTRITEIAPGEFVAVGKAGLVVGDEIVDIATYEKLKFNMSDMTIQPGRSIRLEMEFLDGNRNATVHPHEEEDCGEGFETDEQGYCQDIDECSNNATLCDSYSLCENIDGTYECQPLCEPGFRPRLDDGTCVDVDECEKNPCRETEYCMNIDGSYTCLDKNPCQPGFVYNSHTDLCEDIDECQLENSCTGNLRCVNQLGSYICLCPNGHAPRNGTCAMIKHRIANQTHGKLHKCLPGFHWDHNFHDCVDVDECVHDWKCEWKCVNNVGGYECLCPDGYYLGDDNKCKDIDECTNDTICVGTGGAELCFNNFGGYQCLEHPCPKNYHIVGQSECHHDCYDCHKPIIRLQMLPVVASVPINSALAKLTAYDKQSRIVNDTIYTISENQDDEKSSGKTTAGSYGIRTDHGQATILSAASLAIDKTTKLRVFAESETNDNSHYLLHVHVSKYNF